MLSSVPAGVMLTESENPTIGFAVTSAAEKLIVSI